MKEICITKGRIAEDSSEFDNSDAEWFVSYEDYEAINNRLKEEIEYSEIIKKEYEALKNTIKDMNKYIIEQDQIILNQEEELKNLRNFIKVF